MGEGDQLLLLVEEPLRHRHLDPDLRGEDLPQLLHPVRARADLLGAIRTVVGERPLDRLVDRRHVVSVDDQLRRGVRCEDQPMDADVREGDRVADQQLAATLRRHPAELAAHRVGVVDRLRERIADPLADAVVDPEPLAVPALDPAALHLQAEDPALGMGDHEIDLAVVGALLLVAADPADRVEDLPALAEPLLERVEDLALGPALEVRLVERPRIHRPHGGILWRPQTTVSPGMSSRAKSPSRPSSGRLT